MCVRRSERDGEVVVDTGKDQGDKNGQLKGQMTMVESNVHHNHYHERNNGEEMHL